MSTRKVVAVSLTALVARINRKLRKQGEKLRRAYTESAQQEVGHYFVVDLNRNRIVNTDVDPEQFARELEVLQPWEALES